MRPNAIRAIWAQGGCALNSFLAIGAPFAAEVMAAQGFDALTVDIQHGMVDAMQAVALFQGMQGQPVMPLARVPANDPAVIGKVLDGGAYGVICPLVNTAADAARLVAACRYPPLGNRSFGPARAIYSAGADYGAAAESRILTFAMIETAEAMANLEPIAATEGLDALYIGPADLALSLTGRRYRLGFDREEPEMIAAIHRIRDAGHAAGKRVALHCGSAEYARRARDWGFDMVTIASDSRFMAQAAGQAVACFRQ
ncbi:HpcH/HpaI aldolase family protein [Paracoccus binzhouensis]|uniref:HpcH/HpaI aldolase family protein n=1 Tax=Paracoccus binzhouensis TaxID=2796149 RepID=UPI0018EF1897|nr:aldolase/citrate lyase family protein [Paracoccus binzhouensis]